MPCSSPSRQKTDLTHWQHLQDCDRARASVAPGGTEAPYRRQRRLWLWRIFRVRGWRCGCGLILRGFWSDAWREMNDLSDVQLIYVGQLRVRGDEFTNSGLRSGVTNGNFLERITILDGNLTSLLRGCGCCGLFLNRGAYSGRGRRGRNQARIRRCRPRCTVAFGC